MLGERLLERAVASRGRDAALRRAAASANRHSSGKYMRADGVARRPYHGILPTCLQPHLFHERDSPVFSRGAANLCQLPFGKVS